MSIQVFRKTEAGREELKLRRAGLAMATRSVLILVNGIDDARALSAKGLADVQSHLDTLAALQLIEVVRSAAPAAARKPVRPAAPSPVAKAPPDAAAPAAPAAPAASEDLPQQQRELMHTLTPHFGPDTPDVARVALAARSLAEFHQALDGIQSKLAIYMGRKQAERALQHLRGAS